jgi:predicted transcriptional regulator
MPDNADLVALSADIVSAFVAHNNIPITDLAGLIASTHATLSGLGKKDTAPESEKLVPAVTIKKSISADYLICLEDGKKFKSLKRHLRVAFNMTPAEYRARWNCRMITRWLLPTTQNSDPSSLNRLALVRFARSRFE